MVLGRLPRGEKLQREKARALPLLLPMVKAMLQNSSRGTVRAADIPTPEYRGPTNHLPGRFQKCTLLLRRSGQFRPANFQCSQKSPVPVRNRVLSSERIADQLHLRVSGPRGVEPLFQSEPAMTLDRDSQSGCTCNSATGDCRDETVFQR